MGQGARPSREPDRGLVVAKPVVTIVTRTHSVSAAREIADERATSGGGRADWCNRSGPGNTGSFSI